MAKAKGAKSAKPKNAAKAERERKIRAAGRAALRDPEQVAQHARRAVAEGAASLSRFSLRNQMLLWVQAEEKGISLTDVDTYKGWARRGRKPARPRDYLLVTVPKRGSRKATDRQDDPEAEDQDEEDGPRSYFMGRRWDISQTVEFDFDDLADDPTLGDCRGCDAHAGQPCGPGCSCFACTSTEDAASQAPAEVMWNTLQNDITRAGYRFQWPGDADALAGRAVHVDHETQTVHVGLFAAGSPDGLAALAVAAAEVLTQRKPTGRRPVAALSA